MSKGLCDDLLAAYCAREVHQVPSGIFRGAPHPNAAKLYLSWLLTPEQQMQLVPGQWSVRADVPPPAGFRPISEYNVLLGYRDFVLDEARIEELQPRYAGYIGPVRGTPVSWSRPYSGVGG